MDRKEEQRMIDDNSKHIYSRDEKVQNFNWCYSCVAVPDVGTSTQQNEKRGNNNVSK
jgi:hypothetical protein